MQPLPLRRCRDRKDAAPMRRPHAGGRERFFPKDTGVLDKPLKRSTVMPISQSKPPWPGIGGGAQGGIVGGMQPRPAEYSA